MQAITRMTSLGSIALLCAACSAAPPPDAATQAAAAPPPVEAPVANTSAATPTMTPPPEAEPSASQQQTLVAQATVTEAAARETALAKVPGGTIQSSELEEEHALLIWSFDIARSGSKNITEIQVDAKTGKVVSNEIETPQAQAKEAAADAQHKP